MNRAGERKPANADESGSDWRAPGWPKNPTESSIRGLVCLSPVPILLGKILRFILEAQLGIWVSSLTGLFSREGYFTEDAKRTISKIVENDIGLPQDGIMGDK